MTPRDGHPAAGALPLPDDCAVRTIDLPARVGALISVGEEGFVNIYLNARYSPGERRRALQHELRHYYRGDLRSARGIREIERGAEPENEPIRAMDGAPLEDPAPAFVPGALRRIGRGIYLPEGENLDRAWRTLQAVRACLDEACRIYDVLQSPPLIPREALRRTYAGLCARTESAPDAVAFIGWAPGEAGELQAVMQISCGDDAASMDGAVYYDAAGEADNAVAVLAAACDGRAFRVTVDLRRRDGALEVWAIHREVDGALRRTLYAPGLRGA